jgi:hypothetical protein
MYAVAFKPKSWHQDTLDVEVQAWAKYRNDEVVKVDWQFTAADTRSNLSIYTRKFRFDRLLLRFHWLSDE